MKNFLKLCFALLISNGLAVYTTEEAVDFVKKEGIASVDFIRQEWPFLEIMALVKDDETRSIEIRSAAAKDLLRYMVNNERIREMHLVPNSTRVFARGLRVCRNGIDGLVAYYTNPTFAFSDEIEILWTGEFVEE